MCVGVTKVKVLLYIKTSSSNRAAAVPDATVLQQWHPIPLKQQKQASCSGSAPSSRVRRFCLDCFWSSVRVQRASRFIRPPRVRARPRNNNHTTRDGIAGIPCAVMGTGRDGERVGPGRSAGNDPRQNRRTQGEGTRTKKRLLYFCE